MFIKYSTGQIPPKKSRGKGSQGKKTVDDSHETVDVSKESEPELVKKKTASRRVVKKKVTIFADDNIIPDLDVALEIVTESTKKKTNSRSSRSVVIQDTPSAPKPIPATLKPKLKGVQSLTPAEKEAVDIMQALKERKKTSKRQPGTGGSSEGTGTIPGVPDESIIISATSNEGTEDQLDDEEKDDKEGDVDDEGDDHISDTQDIDDEDAKTEFDEDEIYKYKIRVRKDKDVEMKNTEEIKDAAKKAELPPTSSSLYVSSGFGDQFLKLSSDNSLVSTVRDNTDVEINSLLEVKIQSELRVAKLEKDVFGLKNIDHSAETIATLKSQVPMVVDDYLGSKLGDALQKALHKYSEDLIHKHSVKLAPESRKIQSLTINLKQGSEKIALEILKIKREQAEKQKMLKYTIKSIDKAALKEYDQKSALYQTMHENKSFNRNPANHKLYHALMEALIEDENAMDKGVMDTVKDHKRKHDDDDDDDDEDPLAGPNHGKKTKRSRTKELESSKKPSTTKETPKGKAPSKGSKTGKSASTKELVEEPIAEVVMDDAGEYMVRDDDQPQDASDPNTANTPNP
ncbi:hypothetical protein Tco_0500775 [Tanacetum coccineum]